VPKRLGFRFIDAVPDGKHAPGEVGIGWIWCVTKRDWLARPG
jgi:hypothetical protein